MNKPTPCPKCKEGTTFIIHTETAPWGVSCGFCNTYIGDFQLDAITPISSCKLVPADVKLFVFEAAKTAANRITINGRNIMLQEDWNKAVKVIQEAVNELVINPINHETSRRI